ncbi:MoaD/ThiS family protein [Kocuria sp. TGY1127_2]|uniref:MoaD/ThiS family protein n=1 Tax=Kocuria sp. TGY1127_2 TaxID=2711328 RepID=UPI0015BAF589|nr:MoaD/ThiS family protein [Kocuria sp. TGY1127_2]
MVAIHYFAAARAARGQALETVEPAHAGVGTLGELVDWLGREHTQHRASDMTLAEVFPRCSFLVDGRRASHEASLDGVERIDIMPPFAGG